VAAPEVFDAEGPAARPQRLRGDGPGADREREDFLLYGCHRLHSALSSITEPAARLNGSNFGFLLTIWDRMFGTYVSPAGLPNDFPLGLNYRVGAARMWIGLPPGRPSEG
jgi:hypothetical protein